MGLGSGFDDLWFLPLLFSFSLLLLMHPFSSIWVVQSTCSGFVLVIDGRFR